MGSSKIMVPANHCIKITGTSGGSHSVNSMTIIKVDPLKLHASCYSIFVARPSQLEHTSFSHAIPSSHISYSVCVQETKPFVFFLSPSFFVLFCNCYSQPASVFWEKLFSGSSNIRKTSASYGNSRCF
jgi:hypothetical protein